MNLLLLFLSSLSFLSGQEEEEEEAGGKEDDGKEGQRQLSVPTSLAACVKAGKTQLQNPLGMIILR